MQPNDRREYMRAYYEANKERLKAKRNPQPRTDASRAAEERYREKKRTLKEIEAMTFGTAWPSEGQG